jgi:RNA polymerase sigma-70 factor (ECF subfamily)
MPLCARYGKSAGVSGRQMERFKEQLHLIYDMVRQQGVKLLNNTDEARLVQRCQTGDQEAFQKLIGLHGEMLFGIAYFYTHDRSQAEDAVQEALIQIWRHIPSLRSDKSVKSWLISIVVNEVKQQYRRKRQETVSLFEMPDIPDAQVDTEDALIRHEEQEIIKEAIKRLPSDQREAVILRYYSELTVPEIAQVLRQPEGTIKSRLSRAREKLAEILGDNPCQGGRD